MDYILDRAWVEINLDNIAHNVRETRRITNENAEIIGVVKADAYGHGVVKVSGTLLENGISRLAVSMLDEAVQLRKKGIEVPILILNYTDPRRAQEVIHYDITQTVFSIDSAEALSKAAVKLGKSVKIHIKIDTGMTRIGFFTDHSAIKSIVEIGRLPGIVIEGLFTHFASADDKDKKYTHMQFERFMNICNGLDRTGVHIPIKHAANSAAIIEFPEMHMDMVRPGIILYGIYPSEGIDKNKVRLIPSMAFKANIVQVKEVAKGSYISYGRIFKTERRSRIATIPVGYADGYTRMMSNKGKVLINGQEAPVVGRVCMDQCMIDVTDIDGDIRVGDKAVLFGKQGGKEIRIDDIASVIGTISYEVACMIGKRIPRAYIKNGKITCIENCLA